MAKLLERVDAEKTVKGIECWLRGKLKESKMKGFIIGNSGGMDSAVVLALCKRVTDNVLGVMMPCGNVSTDAEHGRLMADKFGIENITIDLTEVYNTEVTSLMTAVGLSGISDLAKTNIKPRLRMTTLYAIAQSKSYLVVGTGNLSERTMGYFTKWGDGASDLNPLGNLTKTEVYALGEYLGIPEQITGKKPSAGLYKGQTDEEEMGVSYAEIDEYILEGRTNEKAQEVVERQERETAHKRRKIPIYEL